MNDALLTALAGLVISLTALIWSWVQHKEIRKLKNGEVENGKGDRSSKS